MPIDNSRKINAHELKKRPENNTFVQKQDK
jgi:hypothetical protein